MQRQLKLVWPLFGIVADLLLEKFLTQVGMIVSNIVIIEGVVHGAVILALLDQLFRVFFGEIILLVRKQRLHQGQQQFWLVGLRLIGFFEFLNCAFHIFLYQCDIAGNAQPVERLGIFL